MSVRRWRITDRDIEWLQWMARWRFVTSAAIAREFTARGQSAPPTAVDRRLRAFVDMGLVSYERVLHAVPRLFWLTRDGMAAAEVTGATTKPRLADIRHDLTVIDVAHWLAHHRVRTHDLVTEREICRTETPNRYDARPAHYSIDLPERATHSRAYPDLVSVNSNGRAFGHEVEHSRKDVRRLVRLMLGYVESPTYAGAVYYVTDNAGDGVARAATEANNIAHDRHGTTPITVTRWPHDIPSDQLT